MYILNVASPNWTEVAQVIIAFIGMGAAIIGAWKLLIRDKQRESEVNSLKEIASQMSELLAHNEKRYIESKKPHIELELKRDLHYKLYFKNVNSSAQITKYGKRAKKLSGLYSRIATEGNVQSFSFHVPNPETVSPIKFEMVYIVENTYCFRQLVSIHNEGMRLVAKGGIVTLSERTDEDSLTS